MRPVFITTRSCTVSKISHLKSFLVKKNEILFNHWMVENIYLASKRLIIWNVCRV